MGPYCPFPFIIQQYTAEKYSSSRDEETCFLCHFCLFIVCSSYHPNNAQYSMLNVLSFLLRRTAFWQVNVITIVGCTWEAKSSTKLRHINSFGDGYNWGVNKLKPSMHHAESHDTQSIYFICIAFSSPFIQIIMIIINMHCNGFVSIR